MTRAEGVWIWLSLTPGVGARTARRLVEFFGSEEALWAATQQELAEAAGASLAQKLIASRSGEAVNAHVRDCRTQGMTLLTPASPGYPAGLLDLCDPPRVLYAKGDLSLLAREGVTVVGTRRHTRYGARVTAQLSRELAEAGLVIVSGLAEGLDAAAHQAALDAGGGTIAVLGNGLDVYYPAINAALQDEIAQRGLLLSESPPGKRASKGSFPMRNRILAALTRATLVTEAGEKSGALLTAELAMDCGRELFVVPGNIDSPASYATNRLLRTSAEVVLEARDVLDRLGLAAPEEKTAQELPALDEEEQKIVQCLSREAQSFDELAVLSGFLAPKLNSLLTRLELKGIIDQSAGRVYAMKR